MLGPDVLEKMKSLAADVIGGKDGAMDLLIIEAPKGKASSPEDAMSYAKEIAGEEKEDPEKKEEYDMPDVYKESEGGPETPLFSAVEKLVADWKPETPEGEKYLADLQAALSESGQPDKGGEN